MQATATPLASITAAPYAGSAPASRSVAPKLVIVQTEAEAELVRATQPQWAAWSLEKDGWMAPAQAGVSGPETPLAAGLVNAAAGKDVAVAFASVAMAERLADALMVQARVSGVAVPHITADMDGAPLDAVGLAHECLINVARPMPYRIVVDYAERAMDPADPGRGTAKLQVRLAYPTPGATFLPSWEKQVIEAGKRPTKDEPGTDAKIVWKVLDGVPNVWLTDTIVVRDEGSGETTATGGEGVSLVRGSSVAFLWKGITSDGRAVSFSTPGPMTRAELNRQNFVCASEKVFSEWMEVQTPIMGASRERRRYGTHKRGWVTVNGGRQYVWGTKATFARDASQKLVAVDSGFDVKAYGAAGTMAAQRSIYKLLSRNTPFAAMMGLNMATALLELIEGSSCFYVGFSGQSSTGKTTMLGALASSLAPNLSPAHSGSAMISFASSLNGLENQLYARNGAPTFMDEAHQSRVFGRELEKQFYNLTNGSAPSRMARDGGQRDTKRWLTGIFGSGEQSVASMIARGGSAMSGGLYYRCVEIDVEANRLWHDIEEQASLDGFGVYGPLVASRHAGGVDERGSRSKEQRAAIVIEAVERALGANHGHWWGEWINWLLDDANVELCRELEARERDAFVPPQGASEIFIRRKKHLALAMTGVHAFARMLELGAEETQELLSRCREWLATVFWKAGLGEHLGDERVDMRARAMGWLMANTGRLCGGGGRPENEVGWISPKGAICINAHGRALLAKELGYDPARLAKALQARKGEEATDTDAWKEKPVRYPKAGVQRALCTADGIFRMERDFYGELRIANDWRSDEQIAADEAKAAEAPFAGAYTPDGAAAERAAA